VYVARYGWNGRSGGLIIGAAVFVLIALTAPMSLALRVITLVFFGGGALVFIASIATRRVALRVDGEEPPHVHAFVNRHPAFEAVPDWIMRRPGPGEERQVREEFVQRILMAVHAAISGGTPS